MIHIRNGREERHSRTRGVGTTWCGKKLLGAPTHPCPTIEVFVSYGAEVRVTMDPAETTCQRCRDAFDAAYSAAFPEGHKPIATFRLDSPEDMAKAREMFRPEALESRQEQREGISNFSDVINRALGANGA